MPFPLLLLASATVVPSLATAQKLVFWGDNGSGQFNVPAGFQAAQISVCRLHNLAVSPDGTVAAWGGNTQGQSNAPAGLVAAQVSAGHFHSLALRNDGTVAAWGYNLMGQCDVPPGLLAFAIAAGGDHSMALRSNGTVTAWGDNAYGQIDVPAGLSAVQIAAGTYHSMALRPDGTVVAWGSNDQRQLNVPAGLSGVVQIAAGDFHSLALRANGTVVAWGYNFFGQRNVPAGLTGVLQVDGGINHSTALVAAAHCLLDQTEVYAGYSATGTVKLADPAPAGGTVVGLASSDPGVHVPETVTVPEGATQWTFPVRTDFLVGADRTVTVQTVYGSTDNEKRTVPAELKVKGHALAVAFNRASLVGGAAEKPVLTLNLANAPAEDVTFDLDTDASLSVPATATIRAGQKSVQVAVTTSEVTATTPQSVRTNSNGTLVATSTMSLTPVVTSASFASAEVVGGSTTKPSLTIGLTVPMSGDRTLTLQSSQSVVAPPASVTIPAGTTSLKVIFPPTGRVSTPTVADITVSRLGSRVTMPSFTVNPNRVGVSFDDYSVVAGSPNLGYLNLNAPVEEALTISLTSDHPSVSVPASVTVKARARAVTFPVSTAPSATGGTVRITGVISGNAYSGTFKLVAVPQVRSVTLPSTMYGNGRAQGTVRLMTAAKAGGEVVQLASSSPSLSMPATVMVPEGQYAATFPVYSSDVDGDQGATVTASNAVSSASANVAIRPLKIVSFVLSVSTVAGGDSVTATLKLNAEVAVGTTIELTRSDPLVNLPATVTVAPGSRTATFTFSTNATSRAKNVRITAAKLASSVYRTLKVTP